MDISYVAEYPIPHLGYTVDALLTLPPPPLSDPFIQQGDRKICVELNGPFHYIKELSVSLASSLGEGQHKEEYLEKINEKRSQLLKQNVNINKNNPYNPPTHTNNPLYIKEDFMYESEGSESLPQLTGTTRLKLSLLDAAGWDVIQVYQPFQIWHAPKWFHSLFVLLAPTVRHPLSFFLPSVAQTIMRIMFIWVCLTYLCHPHQIPFWEWPQHESEQVAYLNTKLDLNIKSRELDAAVHQLHTRSELLGSQSGPASAEQSSSDPRPKNHEGNDLGLKEALSKISAHNHKLNKAHEKELDTGSDESDNAMINSGSSRSAQEGSSSTSACDKEDNESAPRAQRKPPTIADIFN